MLNEDESSYLSLLSPASSLSSTSKEALQSRYKFFSEQIAAKMVKPPRRSNDHFVLKYLIGGGLGLLVYHSYGMDGIEKLVSTFASYMTGQTLIRLCLSREEFGHQLKVRYNNDKMKVFRRIFGPRCWHILLQLACCIYTGYKLFDRRLSCWMMCIPIIRLIMSATPLEKNAFVMDRLISGEHSGLFYGICMAHSYFHGYLNIILPRGEYEYCQNFKERVEDYMDDQSDGENRINVPDKRLYILFPASGEAAPQIADKCYDWMLGANKNLKSEVRNRGGVKLRSYHNTVHRIKDPNDRNYKPVYVVVEYATPLITYNEACRFFSSNESWRSFQKDTVISFYETCQDILEHYHECKSMVKLIYYEDRDENGRDVNVAHVILQAIQESEALGETCD